MASEKDTIDSDCADKITKEIPKDHRKYEEKELNEIVGTGQNVHGGPREQKPIVNANTDAITPVERQISEGKNEELERKGSGICINGIRTKTEVRKLSTQSNRRCSMQITP